ERYERALHGCASAKSFTAADCGTRPREMDSFAEIAEGFDLITVTRSTERYTDVIANVPHGARRVLDVGCGTGVLTERLARDAGLVVGLDVSPSMLALA